jgi:hypothetical protein
MVTTMNPPKPILAKSLNSPEVINQFAQDFVNLQNKWSQLNSKQQMAAIIEIVHKAQKSVGVPTGEILPNSEQGIDGAFYPGRWLINVDAKLLNNSKVLSNEVAEQLALTLYHEARHSEQHFRIAQKEALKFNDNGKLKNSAQIELETGIKEVVVKQAIASVQSLTPEQKKQLLQELAITDPWYRSLYPNTPAEVEAKDKLRNTLFSSYKLAAAAQEKYDFARNHTRQFSWSQINDLEAVATGAKKQYEAARATYIKGLPEEADAEATENKFRASYINKLSSTRQRNTQNAKPATSRNKSEEDWTDKFYNRGANQQSSAKSEATEQQRAILQPDKDSQNIQSVAPKADHSNSPTLYQKLSQIAEKMPHNLVKLGLDPQNPQHQEIFMTMYAINTGIDPHQLLENSPYNNAGNHTELIISQATAKINEATTASTTRNIDKGDRGL